MSVLMVSWLFVIISSSILISKLPILFFYLRAAYYTFCLIVGGLLGGIASIPFGVTADNHFRVFKIFQLLSWPLNLKFHLRNSSVLKSEKPYIVIANHQSALDVLGMSFAWPVNCVVMLKSSLKYLPGINFCAFMCAAIYINRFSKAKAHKTVGDTLREIVEKNRKVWIFPEGTRNSAHSLLPFKKGAFILAKEAKIPIVPCVFSSHKYFYSYEESRLTGGHCIVEVLPEINPTDFETIDEMSDFCRRVMQEKREELNKEAEQMNRS